MIAVGPIETESTQKRPATVRRRTTKDNNPTTETHTVATSLKMRPFTAEPGRVCG